MAIINARIFSENEFGLAFVPGKTDIQKKPPVILPHLGFWEVLNGGGSGDLGLAKPEILK